MTVDKLFIYDEDISTTLEFTSVPAIFHKNSIFVDIYDLIEIFFKKFLLNLEVDELFVVFITFFLLMFIISSIFFETI